MAKKSMMIRAARTAKFGVRSYSRCPICGRPRAYIRKYNLCRICFRNMALAGEIPGVIKASW